MAKLSFDKHSISFKLSELNYWTTNVKTIFEFVMNMLLIYLLASVELEKGHKKTFLGSSFKIMLHYYILRNRLLYYMELWFK